MRINNKLKCDMTAACAQPVTHIDAKGFVYCTGHGEQRRAYRPCRALAAFEVEELTNGRTIRYKLATRATALAAAQRKWGANVEAFGHLSTVGPSSGPYRRDGQKEFHALVRHANLPSYARDQFLVNVTAPTAAQAWMQVMAVIEGVTL